MDPKPKFFFFSMLALQASLLCRPSSLHSLPLRRLFFTRLTRRCNPSPSFSISSSKPLSRHRLQPLVSPALPPKNANSATESTFPCQDWVSDLDSPESQGFVEENGGESIRAKLDDVVSGEFRHEEKIFSDFEGKQSAEGRFRLVVFMMGVFATLRNGFEKFMAGKWLGLWQFWQQEKKLDGLGLFLVLIFALPKKKNYDMNTPKAQRSMAQ